MNLALVEDIIEALHLAGRTVKNLPTLPEPLQNGMLPVLSALRAIQDEEGKARVTDVSKYLKLTSPCVIRIIGQCEKSGLIEKWKDTVDKRVMNIRMTPRGEQVLENTMDAFHAKLAERFSEIEDEEWKTLVKLLSYTYETVGQVCREIDYQLPDWKEPES